MSGKNTTLFYTQGTTHSPVKFISTDAVTNTTGSTGALKTIFTAGINDSIWDVSWACSDDTINHDVILFEVDGSGNKYCMGTVSILAGAGTSSGVLPGTLLDKTKMPYLKVDLQMNPYYKVKSGWSIQVGILVAVSSGKTLTIGGDAADF